MMKTQSKERLVTSTLRVRMDGLFFENQNFDYSYQPDLRWNEIDLTTVSYRPFTFEITCTHRNKLKNY